MWIVRYFLDGQIQQIDCDTPPSYMEDINRFQAVSFMGRVVSIHPKNLSEIIAPPVR